MNKSIEDWLQDKFSYLFGSKDLNQEELDMIWSDFQTSWTNIRSRCRDDEECKYEFLKAHGLNREPFLSDIPKANTSSAPFKFSPTILLGVGILFVGLLLVCIGIVIAVTLLMGKDNIVETGVNASYTNKSSSVEDSPSRSKNSCRISVPQTNAQGVVCFEVKKGDILDIKPSGQARARADGPPTGPMGENNDGYSDTSVDSPFSKNVGGLEMWIGSKSNQHYLVGTPQRFVVNENGSLTFRTIDSLTGFKGTGAYTVVVTK